MMVLSEIKKHPGIINCIKKTEHYLDVLGFTDHGPRHINIVSDRARVLAKKMGLDERDQELAAIAGYCHDIGNFFQRPNHCYTGALLFSHFFLGTSDDTEGVLEIMQAIANHDEKNHEIISRIGAILILSDKSDVHRSRVKDKDRDNIMKDIHDRVNYSVTDSSFKINNEKKEVVLKLKIDTEVTGVMEYFEIFNSRTIFCRRAAKFIGYNFVLVINNFKLS
jgi:uncharacterized protein